MEFKSNVLCKSIATNKFNIRYELYLKKFLVAEGSLDTNGWARVKHELTKSREHLLRMKFFDSGHLQQKYVRPDMKREYMNSDKAQLKKKQGNNFIKWSGLRHKYAK